MDNLIFEIKSLLEEYEELLKIHDSEYDPRYIFKPIEWLYSVPKGTDFQIDAIILPIESP